MAKNKKPQSYSRPIVDKGLIKMFLKLSPEERIQANDNAIRTFSELNNAFKQQKTAKRKSKTEPQVLKNPHLLLHFSVSPVRSVMD
jgi:hypothetical protein